MKNLRPFQETLFKATIAALAALAAQNPTQLPNVLVQSATGSGKTVILGALSQAYDVPQAAIAHRQELVGQISRALASNGIRHGVIAPDAVVSAIAETHRRFFGTSFISPRSWTRVCGVDTLIRMDRSDPWLKSVRLRFDDECHHVLRSNKWGKGVEMFPNAMGVGFTATPCRADGRGLGREWDGIYDQMIQGPKMRELIRMGYLTDYRLVIADCHDLDWSRVEIGANGELKAHQRAEAVAESSIVGDVVNTYLRMARGRLGVTFADNIEEAGKLVAAFRAKGVPAEIVTGKTPDTLRTDILERFARREILQLVNVDLFGEGFDLPALEVVSMARRTMSFALYAQQFGRALRLDIAEDLQRRWGDFTDAQRLAYIAQSPKPKAMIIDHVGNWRIHNVPDNLAKAFYLESTKNYNAPSDAIPLRECVNPKPRPETGELCLGAYERHLKACPHCGYAPVPAARDSVAAVDGDMYELDPAVLARLQGEIAENLSTAVPEGMPYMMREGLRNRKLEAVAEVEALRRSMALWGAGASLRHGGLDDREQSKLFYLTFGVDVLSAQTLKRASAEKLRERIDAHIAHFNVTELHA